MDSQSVLLDGVDTPGNVGMLLRNAVAAQVSGVIIHRKGCPDITPLVIKASAGTAFSAPIVKAESASSAAEQLIAAGHSLIGLRTDKSTCLYSFEHPQKATWVLGNETHGISTEVAQHITHWVKIPMPGPAESLNVAVAGGIVMFEMVRRQMAKRAPTGA